MDYEKILNSQFKMTDAGRIDKVRDLYTTYNPRVDLEALKEGGYLDALSVMMEPVLDNFDERSPEVIAYWAKMGMVKEFHGDDEPMSWSEYEKDTAGGGRASDSSPHPGIGVGHHQHRGRHGHPPGGKRLYFLPGNCGHHAV